MMSAVNKVLAWLLSIVFSLSLVQTKEFSEQLGFTLEAPGAYAVWPTEEFARAPKLGWLGTGLAMEAVYGLIGMMHGGPETAGLLVLHKGYIVYERYGGGADEATPHAMYSVTKSVISALVGIAIGEGAIKSIDQKVIDFFPEAVIAPGQGSKRKMTIRHLLTMTSGLPADNDENDCDWWEAEDSGLAAFTTAQVAEPGEKFSYNSGAGMQTLACLVSRAVKQNLLAYAKAKLFGPLGMDSVIWDAARDGSNYGGFGLSMTLQDMARFGYLYLNQGRWEGRQIIPKAYIAASAPPSEHHAQYGLLFWTFNKFSNFPGTYEANGSFGQYIDVFPEWDTVIVRAGNLGALFETAATMGIQYLGFDSMLPKGVPLADILGPLGKADLVPS